MSIPLAYYKPNGDAVLLFGSDTRKSVWRTHRDTMRALAGLVDTADEPPADGLVYVANEQESKVAWRWDGEIDGERVPIAATSAREAGWEVVRTVERERRKVA